jgi:hypothetical protein
MKTYKVYLRVDYQQTNIFVMANTNMDARDAVYVRNPKAKIIKIVETK